MSQKHYIRRQLFELRIRGDTDAFGIQQSLSRHFWEAIVPVMSELFDQLVPEDQVITIDKLEIDLGAIPLKELISEEGLSKLIRQLSLVLSGKIETSGYIQPKKSTSAHVWEHWFHFIEFGSIPWSCENPKSDWWQTVLKEFVIDSSLVVRLRKLLSDYPITINRLIWQHSDAFLTSLLEIYSGHSHKDLMHTRNQLLAWHLNTHGLVKIPVSGINSQNPTFKKDPKWYREHFWGFVLRLVILKQESIGTLKLMTSYLQHLFTTEQLQFWMQPGNIENKISKAYPIVIQLLLEIQKSIGQTLSGPGKTAKDKNRSDDHDHIHKRLIFKEFDKYESSISGAKSELLFPASGMDKTHDGQVNQRKDHTDQVWYVDAAGMVLLHPYLSRFFEKLALIKDSDFVTSEYQYRAIHLLYYLATGQFHPMEYELPLAKAICNWPQGAPLPKDVPLANDEIDECKNLLSSVIKNWSILGNTSVEGLREGFLLRQGKLSKQEDEWQLWVEQKSIDVLLDQLPWNLSLIKLPWMKQLLKVEWR